MFLSFLSSDIGPYQRHDEYVIHVNEQALAEETVKFVGPGKYEETLSLLFFHFYYPIFIIHVQDKILFCLW